MKGIEEKQIEAPYELPEGWKWCRLGDVADCLDGFRKPINATERAGRTGNVPYYGATGQVGWIDDFLTNEELVLLGEDGAPFLDLIKEKAYLISGKAWVNNHAHILRSKYGEIGNRYLLNYLNIFNYSGYVNGTTRLKLTQGEMLKIPFPLPPTLAEQQRIVNRIESMFAKLDEAKEKAQNVVDGFETRKAAILHKAFTGELTAKWRKENGVSDDSWEEKRFDEFCLLKRGFDLPATQRIEGMYPLVSSSGIIDTHNEAKVKAPGIVTGRSGSIGKVFYIEEDFFPLNTTLYSQNLFGNNARYVYYYLSNFDFKSFSSSTAVPTLNRNNFSKVELKVPTLPEQVEIVRILDILIEKENKAKQAAEAVLEQIDLLKKSILARAFRGEL